MESSEKSRRVLEGEEGLSYKGLIQALLISFVITALSSLFLSPLQSTLVWCLVLLVVLWTNEGLPAGVVSLLPIVLFPSLGILELKATTAGYSHPIIFLFLGGFFLSLAVDKSNLHQQFVHFILKVVPATPFGLILALAGCSAFLSSILSNTTTSLLLMPLGIHLGNNLKEKTKFCLAIAYGASIGGVMTPVGTPPNLILMGFLEQNSLPMLSFTSWCFHTVPLALVMLVLMALLLCRGMSGAALDVQIEAREWTRDQKLLLSILAALGFLLLVNSPIKPYTSGLGLNEKIILLSFGLLLFLPGVKLLKWEDTRKTPYEILFLFGAGFTIAAAVQTTGLDKELASLISFTSNWPAFLFLLSTAALITFATELTSNTALITVALPVLFQVCESNPAVDANQLLMLSAVCASYAFMLPISTPPNAIAISSGYVKPRDLFREGFVLNCLAILLTSLTAYLFW